MYSKIKLRKYHRQTIKSKENSFYIDEDKNTYPSLTFSIITKIVLSFVFIIVYKIIFQTNNNINCFINTNNNTNIINNDNNDYI